MSAAPKILEGTWEEILQRAPELAGHRLQVQILDPAADKPSIPAGMDPHHPGLDDSPEAVNAWVARLRTRAETGPEIRLGDDSRDTIYEDFLK